MEQNKNVIVVTGGTSGIGFAVTRDLLREGNQVAALVRDVHRAQVQWGDAEPGTPRFYQCDISIAGQVKRAVATVHHDFGRIDGAFLNAAEMSPEVLGRDTNVLDIDFGVWHRTFEVNLLGNIHILREVVPRMLELGSGNIVLTTSDSAFFGDAERPAYGASKAALNSIVRHVATAWGKQGIRINGVSPGTIRTETLHSYIDNAQLEGMLENVPSPRLGVPDDLSGLVQLLLSPRGAYINGQILHINGGSMMF